VTRERAYRLEKEEEGKREKEREDKRTEKGAGDKRIGLQTKEGGRRETKDRRLEKGDAD
jgi:hypothetical protein